MSDSLDEHIEHLRSALCKLRATGETGFEGLLAVTLTEITGVPFRLAGSGSQFGVDATAAYIEDAVCFEGKRYDDQIPRNEILAKIAELSIRDQGGIDLWVLGATTQVKAQHANDVREIGAKHGITTLILDWTIHDLPPLAVTLAMAKEPAAEFFAKNVGDSDIATNAAMALTVIRGDARFVDHAARLRNLLEEPVTGTPLARLANTRWLKSVFSSRHEARRFLRQPLCPGDRTAGEPASRETLVNQVAPLLTGKPDGRVGVILGDEGNGKSWLVAQTWLSLADKPLMVVFTADDFSETFVADGLVDKLIVTLIAQTDGTNSEAAWNRWRRRLEQWRKTQTTRAPRLVVLIDGLNQRPQIDWAWLIEAMSLELDGMGGRLLVTMRSVYYTSRIRERLYSAPAEVVVPEWTAAERDAILVAHGIRASGLRALVAQSLRNPRLLGIALELLQSAQLEELEELSVSRLLFEYMSNHERDAPSPRSAHEFARKLQDRAREILDRVTVQQRDDLTLFDGGLEAVSDGRFFIPVEGDPTRYRLNDDGLTLALGFAVLDELRKALRNKHDLAAALAAIIEPVGALDRTAEVIFSALTVACLDGNCHEEIRAAIVGAFAELQNPNPEEFLAFAALAKKRPRAFMQASECLCLRSVRQPNFDWIEAALHEAKADERAWSVMAPMIQSWLARYSLAPETRMFAHSSCNSAEKVEDERAKRQSEIDQKIEALSGPERDLLDTLSREDEGDLASLTRLGLMLMTDRPIAPFAIALAQWSFATALNGGHGAPYEEFMHLIRLNPNDWPLAREAILRTSMRFESPEISQTGRWALVTLLQATGDPTDAARAEPLIEELTADWPKLKSWRLVEEYCATDPCDPGSEMPENIAWTAEKYAAIDVSKIRLNMGSSEADHFFAMARPGIARFVPQVGIEKHREFIGNAITRNGVPLRQGLFEVCHHNALVTRDHAEALLKQFTSGAGVDTDGTLGETDRWNVSQYHLLLAFPLLDAKEQIGAMLSNHMDEKLLPYLMQVAKPLDEKMLDDLLEEAIQKSEKHAQYRLLFFARCIQTPVSPKVRGHLATLARSESEAVRAQALGLIVTTGDEPSVEAVVKSEWSAANLVSDDGYEAWYGSLVILEGAVRGMIPHEEALQRIAPQLYGRAASQLGGNAARDIARLIDASIKSASNLALDTAVPEMELFGEDGSPSARFRLWEKPPASGDILETLRRLSESKEAFEERQKRIADAFEVFKAKLTKAEARIILDRLNIQEFDAIAEADRALAQRWFDLFIDLPPAKRGSIHNLGLLLAHALAGWDPDKAVALFSKLSRATPLVRMTYGQVGITLDAMTVWSAKNDPALEPLRFDRLDRAGSDYEIAQEILAALLNGKQVLLKGYIESRLQAGEPRTIARALMVAGFSRQSEFNDAVLVHYKDTPGFIGGAQVAAMYAYERNVWSEHWFRQLHEAETPGDFWRYSVLLEKIVDGRLDVFRSDALEPNEPYTLFWPSVAGRLDHRYKKWRSQREKKLFGAKAPPRIFL